jgi:hypothetical protein
MPRKDPVARREYEDSVRDERNARARARYHATKDLAAHAAAGRAWRAKNPTKSRAHAKAWRIRNRDAVVEAKLVSRYGVSLQRFKELHQEQGGACAICGVVPKSRLHVDHDHDSGKVRGLLCGSCNRGIGYLGEDPGRLEAAAAYIRRFR